MMSRQPLKAHIFCNTTFTFESFSFYNATTLDILTKKTFEADTSDTKQDGIKGKYNFTKLLYSEKPRPYTC